MFKSSPKCAIIELTISYLIFAQFLKFHTLTFMLTSFDSQFWPFYLCLFLTCSGYSGNFSDQLLFLSYWMHFYFYFYYPSSLFFFWEIMVHQNTLVSCVFRSSCFLFVPAILKTHQKHTIFTNIFTCLF